MTVNDHAGRLTRSAAKDLLYSKYVTTHTAERDGAASAERFLLKNRAWDRRMGWTLPSDPSARVIDVGCGSGSLVFWLQHRGFTAAEGVDISPETVEQAQSAGVSNVHCSDAHTWLAERPDTYDLVFLRDVLEHFPLEEDVELLESVRSALRPGGRVILQVPNAESPLVGRVRWGDLTHEGAFTPGSIGQLLRAVGYVLEDVRPVVPVLPTKRRLHRYLLWKMIEAVYRFLGYAEGEPYKRVVSQNMLVAARRTGTASPTSSAPPGEA